MTEDVVEDGKETNKEESKAETRRMYQTLLEESNTFTGFDTGDGATFKDKKNTKALDELITYVRAGNPTFQASAIRAAAYTYYRTLTQNKSLQKRGKLEDRNKVRRRRERTLRKMQDRLSFLEKSSLSERDKLKWKALMSSDFMSSEESDPEDTGTLIKRTISWRSDKVSDFFYELDRIQEESRTGQGKRQRKSRILVSDCSPRPVPVANAYGKKIPSWAIKATD